MPSLQQLVVFRLDNQKYAVSLEAVERVIAAVEVTPLPEAPEILAGIINLRGRIVPVVDLRRRLGLSGREIALSDAFLVVRSTTRTMALIVDGVECVTEMAPRDLIVPEAIFPGIGVVEGVMCLDDGLIVILDLEKFLAIPNEKSLEQALQSQAAQAF